MPIRSVPPLVEVDAEVRRKTDTSPSQLTYFDIRTSPPLPGSIHRPVERGVDKDERRITTLEALASARPAKNARYRTARAWVPDSAASRVGPVGPSPEVGILSGGVGSGMVRPRHAERVLFGCQAVLRGVVVAALDEARRGRGLVVVAFGRVREWLGRRAGVSG